MNIGIDFAKGKDFTVYHSYCPTCNKQTTFKRVKEYFVCNYCGYKFKGQVKEEK